MSSAPAAIDYFVLDKGTYNREPDSPGSDTDQADLNRHQNKYR